MPRPAQTARLNTLYRQGRVVELFLQGVPVADLAEQYGVHQATIYRDIQCAHELCRQATSRRMEDKRAEEEMQLRLARQEAWRAWRRSAGVIEEIVTKRHGDTITVTRRLIPRAGDRAFLAEIRETSNSLARLLNLDVVPERAEEVTDDSSRTLLAVATTREEAEPGRSGERLYGQLPEIPDARDGAIAAQVRVPEAGRVL